jgi:hypothetical protein
MQTQMMHVEPDAQLLVQRYGLGSVIDRVHEVVSTQKATPRHVVRIDVSTDHDWGEDDLRLLVTVSFDTDLVGAYEAWKDIRPLVTPVTQDAEERDLLAFTFAGQSG